MGIREPMFMRMVASLFANWRRILRVIIEVVFASVKCAIKRASFVSWVGTYAIDTKLKKKNSI